MYIVCLNLSLTKDKSVFIAPKNNYLNLLPKIDDHTRHDHQREATLNTINLENI